MIKFKRNKKTGILEVWKNGKKIGEIITMGDQILGNVDIDQNQTDKKKEDSKTRS